MLAHLALVRLSTCLHSQSSEREVHEAERFVDVVLLDQVSEIDLRERLRESDDAEQGSGCDVHVTVHRI